MELKRKKRSEKKKGRRHRWGWRLWRSHNRGHATKREKRRGKRHDKKTVQCYTGGDRESN